MSSLSSKCFYYSPKTVKVKKSPGIKDDNLVETLFDEEKESSQPIWEFYSNKESPEQLSGLVQESISYVKNKIALILGAVLPKLFRSDIRLAQDIHIDDILELYRLCSHELVLPPPTTRKEVQQLLPQIFISLKKDELGNQKVAGILEARTLKNGGLKIEKMKNLIENESIGTIPEDIEKIYTQELEKVVYVKRILTHPNFRKRQVARELKIFMVRMFLQEGIRYAAGSIRIWPNANHASLITHIKKEQGLLLTRVIKKGKDGKNYVFGLVHYDFKKKFVHLVQKYIKGKR